MRIDLGANVGQAQDAEITVKAETQAKVGAGQAAGEGDRTELSAEQAKVQGLRAAVLQLPEVRQEKVAALAAQVQNGSYAVTARQTAEALVRGWTGPQAA